MQNKSAVKTVTVKKCVVCKVDITDKKATAKTCSEKCRVKLFRKTHTKRTGKCLFCKAKFEVKNSRKVFCGKRCAESYARLQKYSSRDTLAIKFEILKKFGLIAGNEPPKGGRINIELNEIKIQLHCTDLGGAIANNPTQIAKVLELEEIMFFCKCLNINPYKFCSKVEIIEFILLSENFSIIESCINDIWKSYQAPTIDPEKETPTAILTHQEGLFAYRFWECSEKSKMITTLNNYRTYSKL